MPRKPFSLRRTVAAHTSAAYDDTMSHQPPAPANPANAPSTRFFPRIGIAANMRVLDVGCGNGDLSRTLAALVGPGGEVVGIDRSDEALAAARGFAPEPNSAPIRYKTADLTGELPDLGHFDAIVGRRVLMYLPDAGATLARLAQLAAPGAILAFQEHARAALPAGLGDLPVHRQCYALAWDTVAAEGGDVTLGYRLADMVQAAGFTIEQARSEGVLMQPWEESFLPTLIRAMLPRMIERGVVPPGAIDPDALALRIDAERRASGGTIFWDLAFLVSGRREQ
jgi:SAM-dependent methyltransferase